jgi:hypothetical protein
LEPQYVHELEESVLNNSKAMIMMAETGNSARKTKKVMKKKKKKKAGMMGETNGFDQTVHAFR